MSHTFTPPPVPSDQSTTLARVREDNREHDRALQLELFRLTTYVNTLQPRGEFHICLALEESGAIF